MWIRHKGSEETEEHICDIKRYRHPVIQILKHDLHIYMFAKDTKARYDQAIIRACPFCGESFSDYCHNS